MTTFDPYAENYITLTSIDTGKTYDISSLVSDIQYTTVLGGQPGKLVFTLQKDPNGILNIQNGSLVQFIRGGKGVFYGYVFTMGTDATDIYKITCYDQLRYLKNEETILTKDMTVEEVFEKLCVLHQIRNYRVITPTKFTCPSYLHDKKSLYQILEHQIQQADIANGKQYFIRDNFGTLEFNEIGNCKTDVVLGKKALLMSYQFEISIDKDSYNQIKIIKDNKEAKKREVYQVFDSTTQKRWGFLQKLVKAEENQNSAQIEQLANNLLKLHNRETRSLKLTSLGVQGLYAGSGFSLNLPKLKTSNNDQYLNMWILSATHNFRKNFHTMDLEVFIP